MSKIFSSISFDDEVDIINDLKKENRGGALIIFNPSFAIGDYIVSRPILKMFKIVLNTKITILVRTPLQAIIDEFDKEFIDDYITFNVKSWKIWEERINLYKKINSLNFDIVISLIHYFRENNAKIIMASGAKYRIGMFGERYFCDLSKLPKSFSKNLKSVIDCYNIRIFDPYTRNDRVFLADHEKILLESLLNDKISNLSPDFNFENKTKKAFTSNLEDFIVCAIGASNKNRVYPIDKLVNIIISLKTFYDGKIIFLGTSEEFNDVEYIINELKKVNSHKNVVNLCDSSLLIKKTVEFFNTIKNSKFVLCNDSGISHIAASLGTPTCCICPGGSSFIRFQPWPRNLLKNYTECINADGFYGSNLANIPEDIVVDSLKRILSSEQYKYNNDNIVKCQKIYNINYKQLSDISSYHFHTLIKYYSKTITNVILGKNDILNITTKYFIFCNPSLARKYVKESHMLEKENLLPDAIELLNKSISFDNDILYLKGGGEFLGLLYIKTKQYEKANSILHQILKNSPNVLCDMYCYYRFAQLSEQQNNINKAIKYMNRCIDLCPSIIFNKNEMSIVDFINSINQKYYKNFILSSKHYKTLKIVLYCKKSICYKLITYINYYIHKIISSICNKDTKQYLFYKNIKNKLNT